MEGGGILKSLLKQHCEASWFLFIKEGKLGREFIRCPLSSLCSLVTNFVPLLFGTGVGVAYCGKKSLKKLSKAADFGDLVVGFVIASSGFQDEHII